MKLKFSDYDHSKGYTRPGQNKPSVEDVVKGLKANIYKQADDKQGHSYYSNFNQKVFKDCLEKVLSEDGLIL